MQVLRPRACVGDRTRYSAYAELCLCNLSYSPPSPPSAPTSAWTLDGQDFKINEKKYSKRGICNAGLASSRKIFSQISLGGEWGGGGGGLGGIYEILTWGKTTFDIFLSRHFYHFRSRLSRLFFLKICRQNSIEIGKFNFFKFVASYV